MQFRMTRSAALLCAAWTPTALLWTCGWKTPREPEPEVLKCRRLEIVDASGVTRAVFECAEHATQITLGDREEGPGIHIGLRHSDGLAGVSIVGAKHSGVARLSVSADSTPALKLAGRGVPDDGFLSTDGDPILEVLCDEQRSGFEFTADHQTGHATLLTNTRGIARQCDLGELGQRK